ncbi:MAG: NapC/NirT family cytochrome c [Polyangiaceae bacterium]|nr:NapC/NirT family cytochrome c [Polyangiaceae bacterium]
MTFDFPHLLNLGALICAAASAVVLLWYLIRRPPLNRSTRVWLFAGLGPLPIAAAMAGNVSNLEVTKKREFCGSCHVMVPYTDDVKNPESPGLAAKHSKNKWFGDESCYTCHADYGMFGLVVTKIGGMHHVWDYYTDDWDAPGHRPPKLYKPYNNASCTQCHASSGPREPLEHKVHKAGIESGAVGCGKVGCHGPPHRVREHAVVPEKVEGAKL